MAGDLQRLFKHTSIYSIGNVSMRAGAFILLPLYTRYLSVAEYGTLEIMNSTSQIISSFVSVGLAHATLRFYFEYEDETDRLAVISTSLITSIVVTALSVLVLSCFSTFLSKLLFDSTDLVLALNISFAIIVFEMARQIGLSYMRAKEYSLFYVILCLMQLFVQVGCNIYTVAFLKLGVTGVLIGNLLSVFVGLLISAVLIVKECGLRFHFRKIKQMYLYSYPFLFNGIFSAVVSNADRFIIKSFLSMDAVGIYGLAIKFATLIQEIIIEPFQRSFGAFRFSVMKQDNAREIQMKTLNYLVFVVAWGGLAIALASVDIVRLLTTEQYFGVSNYIPLIVLSYIIGSCNYVFQTGILYQKQTIKLFYANVFSGVIEVTLFFILIRYLGIYGACLTLIVQSSINNLVINTFSQRLFKVDYEYQKVIVAIGIAITIYLISLLAINAPIMISLFIKVLLLLAYPALLYLCMFFTKDEISFVYEYIKTTRK